MHIDLPTFQIVGDNCDIHVKASRQSLTRHDRDHHWFNMYAVSDRVLGLNLPDDKPQASIASLPIAAFLPSLDDCVAIRKEFIIIAARVLIQHLPWFKCLQQVVPDHIYHKYRDVMSSKSDIVS